MANLFPNRIRCWIKAGFIESNILESMELTSVILGEGPASPACRSHELISALCKKAFSRKPTPEFVSGAGGRAGAAEWASAAVPGPERASEHPRITAGTGEGDPLRPPRACSVCSSPALQAQGRCFRYPPVTGGFRALFPIPETALRMMLRD